LYYPCSWFGQARYTLYANLAGLVAAIGFVLLIRPETPRDAVLVWCAAQVLVSLYSLWVNARALDVGPSRPLRTGLAMLLVPAAGIAAALALDGGHRWKNAPAANGGVRG